MAGFVLGYQPDEGNRRCVTGLRPVPRTEFPVTRGKFWPELATVLANGRRVNGRECTPEDRAATPAAVSSQVAPASLLGPISSLVIPADSGALPFADTVPFPPDEWAGAPAWDEQACPSADEAPAIDRRYAKVIELPFGASAFQPAICGTAPPLSAEPVERELVAAARPQAVVCVLPIKVLEATLSAHPDNALAGEIPALVGRWQPCAAAEPAEREVQPAVAESAPRLKLAGLSFSPAPDESLTVLPPWFEQWLPAPAAEAVACEVQPAVAGAAVRPKMLDVSLAALPDRMLGMEAVGVASWIACLPADPAEREVQPAAIAVAMEPAMPLRMVDATLAPAPDALSPDQTVSVPDRLDEWMPSPGAAPAEREIHPVARVEALRLPAALPRLAALGPRIYVPFIDELAAPAQPEMAAVPVWTSLNIEPAAFSRPAVLPGIVWPAPRFEALPETAARAGELAPPASAPGKPTVSVGPLPGPVGTVRLTELHVVHANGMPLDGPEAPFGLGPTADSAGGRDAARPVLISTFRALAPGQNEEPLPDLALAPLAEMEFFCQRVPARPVSRFSWTARSIPLCNPGFAFHVAADRPEEPVRKKVVPIVDPAQVRAGNRRTNLARWADAGKVAAVLIVGVGLWFGARAIKFQAELANPVTNTTVATKSPAPAQPARGGWSGVKRVIAARAALQVTDNFHEGMGAWGAGAKSWAPGWSRNADGYVHPGELAVFEPTRNFVDYRLDFYGQIESKGMGWAVRASDRENYYAMKFTVLEPGLRPVIAMVHYPVVGGQKGRSVETPLSIMVHKNRPYHVTVEVRGNRYTASVEGERVNSWTNDSLRAGGVGFFSEAGERARLYWMKVSKNQDWIGQICAYLAGGSDSGSKTAELRRPAPPADRPEPAGPGRTEPALAMGFAIFQRFSFRTRRSTTWIS